MQKEEQKDDFYPFMKVSLNDQNGVVTDEVWTSGERAYYGVIRWDTNKEGDIADWRGLWGTFVATGGREIGRDYQFRFINDDGTLKGTTSKPPTYPRKNMRPAATFKVNTSFNLAYRIWTGISG